MEDFCVLWGAPCVQNDRFGFCFGVIFDALWGSGAIVKIELSRESELNPEVGGGSELRQI